MYKAQYQGSGSCGRTKLCTARALHARCIPWAPWQAAQETDNGQRTTCDWGSVAREQESQQHAPSPLMPLPASSSFLGSAVARTAWRSSSPIVQLVPSHLIRQRAGVQKHLLLHHHNTILFGPDSLALCAGIVPSRGETSMHMFEILWSTFAFVAARRVVCMNIRQALRRLNQL